MKNLNKWTIILNIVFFLISFVLYLKNTNSDDINIGIVLISFQIIYFSLSIKKVEIDERGLILLFGKPILKINHPKFDSNNKLIRDVNGVIIETNDAGLVYVPWLICRLIKITRNQISMELPDEPEKIFFGDVNKDLEGSKKGQIPQGLSIPIRVTFGQPNDKSGISSDDPLNQPQQTLVVTPIVTVRIYDLELFYINLSSNLYKMKKIISDVAETMFTTDFGKDTAAVIKQDMDIHRNNLKKTIGKTIEMYSWGVEFIDALIKPFGLSHDLNNSTNNLAIEKQKALAIERTAEAEAKKIERLAKAEAKKIELKASADRFRLEEEGEGNAKALKLLLEAKAVGNQILMNTMESDKGRLLIMLQTIETAIKGANFSIVPGNELYGALSGIKELYNKMDQGKNA